MPAPTIDERLLPWLLRAVWIGVLGFGGAALDAEVIRWSAALGWIAGVAAMAIPGVVNLTLTRTVVPLAVPASLLTIGSGDAPVVAGFVACALVATAIAFSGELGRLFVQASAYGEEDRYPLRPPAAYALATGVTWAIWATCVIASPILIERERWIAAACTAVLTIAGAVWLWPRFHKLSRRWFVLVPVGVVVHDHLVLAETVMVRRHELSSIGLADASTQATDLSGPAGGHALELALHEPTTVILAATPKDRRGIVIEPSAWLVTPSRPGKLLTAARARRLPVS